METNLTVHALHFLQMKVNNMKITSINFFNLFCLLYFTLIFPTFAAKPIPEQSIPEEAVELMCDNARNQALHILLDLEIKLIKNAGNRKLESYREVFIEGLISERTRLGSKIKKDKDYSNLLSISLLVAEENYKFALCEKFIRQDAKPITIAEEAYMACRIDLTLNQRSKKRDCF